MNPVNWQIIALEAVRAQTAPQYQLCPREQLKDLSMDDLLKYVDLYATSLNARVIVLSSSLLLVGSGKNGCIMHGNSSCPHRKLTAIYQGTTPDSYTIDVIDGCEEAVSVFGLRPYEDPIAAIEAEIKLSVEWFANERKNPIFQDIESYTRWPDTKILNRIISTLKRNSPRYQQVGYYTSVVNRFGYTIHVAWYPNRELRFEVLGRQDVNFTAPKEDVNRNTRPLTPTAADKKRKADIIRNFLRTV